MKTTITRSFPAVFLIVFFLLIMDMGCSTIQKEMCPCDTPVSKILAKAYILSFPFNEEDNYPKMINLLRNFDSNLDENSQMIKCAKLLGNSLVQAGLQNYINNNRRDARESMYNIGAGAGIDPEITEKAYQDMISNDSNLEMIKLGEELLWLAEVLPPAVQGDSEPYFSTGTEKRQAIRQILPLVIGLDSDSESLLKSLLRENQGAFFSMMEEQLIIYSILACTIR